MLSYKQTSCRQLFKKKKKTWNWWWSQLRKYAGDPDARSKRLRPRCCDQKIECTPLLGFALINNIKRGSQKSSKNKKQHSNTMLQSKLVYPTVYIRILDTNIIHNQISLKPQKGQEKSTSQPPTYPAQRLPLTWLVEKSWRRPRIVTRETNTKAPGRRTVPPRHSYPFPEPETWQTKRMSVTPTMRRPTWSSWHEHPNFPPKTKVAK